MANPKIKPYSYEYYMAEAERGEKEAKIDRNFGLFSGTMSVVLGSLSIAAFSQGDALDVINGVCAGSVSVVLGIQAVELLRSIRSDKEHVEFYQNLAQEAQQS